MRPSLTRYLGATRHSPTTADNDVQGSAGPEVSESGPKFVDLSRGLNLAFLTLTTLSRGRRAQ